MTVKGQARLLALYKNLKVFRQILHYLIIINDR